MYCFPAQILGSRAAPVILCFLVCALVVHLQTKGRLLTSVHCICGLGKVLWAG